MKQHLRLLLAIVIFMVALTTAAGAETMYVTDILRLTLRSGPGAGNEIVAVAQSGQELEVIVNNEEWSQVRLPNGKEGWVLRRYLTPYRTSKLKLEILRKKFDALMAQTTSLREENARLKKDFQKTSAELEKNNKTVSKVKQSYETLKSESAEFLKLKANHKKAMAELAEKSTRIEKLEDDLAKIESQRTIRWFLMGAGVLLIGLIIGFSAKRQRRRLLT